MATDTSRFYGHSSLEELNSQCHVDIHSPDTVSSTGLHSKNSRVFSSLALLHTGRQSGCCVLERLYRLCVDVLHLSVDGKIILLRLDGDLISFTSDTWPITCHKRSSLITSVPKQGYNPYNDCCLYFP